MDRHRRPGVSELTRDALKMALCWAAWLGRDARELEAIKECTVNLAAVGAVSSVRRDMARMVADIETARVDHHPEEFVPWTWVRDLEDGHVALCRAHAIEAIAERLVQVMARNARNELRIIHGQGARHVQA